MTHFHHLPVERFIGKRVKASLPEMGVCFCVFKKAKHNIITVALKKKGVEFEYKVEPHLVNPHWTENQDLFQEMMVAKNAKEHVGQNNLGVVFEAAVQPALQAQNESTAFSAMDEDEPYPQPVSAAIPAIKSKPIPKPMETPPQPAAPASPAIKRLIVSVDCADGWETDLKDLKKIIADKVHHQALVDLHTKALEEHDGLVRLCAEALEAKGVDIIWDGEATPVEAVKTKVGPRARNQWKLLEKDMLERMVPLTRYTLQELADQVQWINNKEFTNRLYAVINYSKHFESAKKPGSARLYHLK